MQKLICIVLMMLIALSFIVLSVREVVRTEVNPSDSTFSPAAEIIGQPMSVAETFGRSYSSVIECDVSDQVHCLVEPAAGIFSKIDIISLNGTIVQIVYTMHDNSTQVGDLIWLWGQPEVQRQRRLVYLFWHGRRIIAVTQMGTERVSLSLPVQTIYFQCGNVCLDSNQTQS